MENNALYGEYFESIFRHSNYFTKEEYRQHAVDFGNNHGKFLPLDKNAAILDVGCGAGHFLHFLEKKGYVNFLGIDVSQQQVEFCKSNVSPRVENADAFTFLQNKINVYDAITANDFLEHIPKQDIIRLLELINKALKPGGVFIARTPNLGNPFAIFLRYKDFTHEVGFSEMSFYQVLWYAGFRGIKIEAFIYKSLLEKAASFTIHFLLRKLFWYQGFVAPRILTPVLIGIATKS
jgi:2-polyprenyl-3-methyl-5-hydroxy-6-metoxy-1,4-benzoquinol methylase